ncbi:MAG: ACP phosphodiesterase [Bacteroidota bacterium]
MNFLAHAFLSGDDDQILVGNFIGDFVKGNQLESFEHRIRQGVILHRSIDEFTDSHPTVSSSKDKLRDKYRHYSGVIVDMFYDHFLAHNWAEYHDLSLLEFTEKTYTTVWSYEPVLPGPAKRVIPHMRRGNWLLQYAHIDGIHQALSGMSRRTTFRSKMEQASENLRQDYDLFKADFDEFFPELRAFVKRELDK